MADQFVVVWISSLSDEFGVSLSGKILKIRDTRDRQTEVYRRTGFA